MQTRLRVRRSISMKSAHVNKSIGAGSSFLGLWESSKSVQERIATSNEPCGA
jgi:hypothetical protein